MNAFLINVAWGDEHLTKMLNTLEKHQVKATFFLEGKWVKNSPDLAKKSWQMVMKLEIIHTITRICAH